MIEALAIKIALAFYITDKLLDFYKKYLETKKLRLETKKIKSEQKYKPKHWRSDLTTMKGACPLICGTFIIT